MYDYRKASDIAEDTMTAFEDLLKKYGIRLTGADPVDPDEVKKFTVPEITLGNDSKEPRKKLWGRIGMMADLTEREFDILQGGGPMAEVLMHSLIENRRFRMDGETYFPEASGDDAHEIGNEICLNL